MTTSEHNGPFAERRHRRQIKRLEDARCEVSELRAAGMGAHEIVAAFRARRRLMVDSGDPTAGSLLGQVPIPIGDTECLMLEIFDDVDD